MNVTIIGRNLMDSSEAVAVLSRNSKHITSLMLGMLDIRFLGFSSRKVRDSPLLALNDFEVWGLGPFQELFADDEQYLTMPV